MRNRKTEGQNSATSQDSSVGYGRPPQAHQFKPGQSGNPKGRRKGTKNFATIFYEALNRKYTIQENGKTRTITGREGIVLRFVNAALKGDVNALRFILAIEPQIERNAEQIKMITSDMTAQEAADAWAQAIKK